MVPSGRAFRIEGRIVAFTVFDVTFITCPPVIERKVEFDGEQVSGDLGRMVRDRMVKY